MTLRSLVALALFAFVGCTRVTTGGQAIGGSSTSGSASSSGSTGSTGTGATCTHCLSDPDCANAGECVQLGADSYCLPSCATVPCQSGNCEQVSDYAGNPEQVCVPLGGACNNDTSCPGGCPSGQTCDVSTRACVGGSGSTGSSAGETCGSLVGPDMSADCTCADGHTCSANNCYGGYWCDTSSNRCVAPPTGDCASGSTGGTTGSSCDGLLNPSTPSSACSCPTSVDDCQPNGCYGGYWCDPVAHRCHSAPDCGSGGTGSSGTTGASGTTGVSPPNWTGSVAAQGGTVSELFFSAVGDARPPNEDDTANYPTAIITKIFQDLSATKPEFVISTGDYMFANPSGTQGAAQVALYMTARQAYSGVLFAAMGNHECNGYTDSNCAGAPTNNYNAFAQSLLAPLGQANPYYRFDVNDAAGQWTAKFVVLAMNAWDATQANWLQQQLAQTTTYTFIVRHEPDSADTAPGVTPSDTIIGQYPYTLKIVGHTHEFARYSTREVIVGNGGAPISGSSNYGYATFTQTASGDIQVTNYDYASNAPVSSFTVPK